MTRDEAQHVLKLLAERKGMETAVSLVDGNVVTIVNSSWGMDLGQEFEHIYANVAPMLEGREAGYFLVSEIAEIADEHGVRIFKPAGQR